MICHMYGWGVPAVLTLVALLTHSIEADELTSVCLPGIYIIYTVLKVAFSRKGCFSDFSSTFPLYLEEKWMKNMPRMPIFS